MHRSRIATVLGTTAAATLLTVTQASAATIEIERATATTYTDNVEWVECASRYDSNGIMDYQACYSPDGDWFQVWDGDSDGSSAVVQWELVDGDRFGAIYNADGNQTYRYKNKNLPEGDEVRFRVCEGHWSTKLITAGTCSMYASNPT